VDLSRKAPQAPRSEPQASEVSSKVFTGIVEAVGRVVAVEPRGALARLRVEAPAIAAEAPLGASVAVNGACLTVTEAAGGEVAFDAVSETLACTALGELRPGARVNLERALRADGRLDGHIVQGHVDGTGRVRSLERCGEDVRLAVACEPGFARLLVEKGSIAVDGVALTLVGVGEDGFDVALIPHTLRETNLGDRRPGDRVNLEADVLGKYVLRYLERVYGKAS
jgi:riboflavin synthase